MTLKINSYYIAHHAAVESLAAIGIELNVIPNNSPYVLASNGNPDLVIHPNSNTVDPYDFPHIKFAGRDCEYPHVNFDFEVGIPDFDMNTSDAHYITNEIVFLNSMNDRAFIKFLESLDLPLSIYGKQCDSIYYKGPLKHNTHKTYMHYSTLAVDNVQEALIAIKVVRKYKQKIYSNFNYIDCCNFKDRGLVFKNDDPDFLENKRWVKIFEKLINEAGLK